MGSARCPSAQRWWRGWSWAVPCWAGRCRRRRTGGRGYGWRPWRLADAGEAARDRCRQNELAVWSRVLRDDDDAEPIQTLPSHDLGLLAVSLTDVDLRDALIAWLCPGAMPRDLIDPRLLGMLSAALPAPPRLDGEVGEIQHVLRLERIERRLCELCAALPDVWAVSALTVLASFAWWRGDGALTRIALDRALRVDPHYRLARLLERMVDLAIRPERASA